MPWTLGWIVSLILYGFFSAEGADWLAIYRHDLSLRAESLASVAGDPLP